MKARSVGMEGMGPRFFRAWGFGFKFAYLGPGQNQMGGRLEPKWIPMSPKIPLMRFPSLRILERHQTKGTRVLAFPPIMGRLAEIQESEAKGKQTGNNGAE